jgi:hypothetical protein
MVRCSPENEKTRLGKISTFCLFLLTRKLFYARMNFASVKKRSVLCKGMGCLIFGILPGRDLSSFLLVFCWLLKIMRASLGWERKPSGKPSQMTGVDGWHKN